MSADARARVVLFWHMHQPEYRIGGVPQLPWAYLHALRAYSDMASHLETVAGARAVVNFSPVLLDQLVDLAQQAQAAVANAALPAEPLLAALLRLPPPGAARAALVGTCVRVHERNAQERFVDYARLSADAGALLQRGPEAAAAIPEAMLTDLVVWYHLVWLGESVRLNDARAQALIGKRQNFDRADCRQLLALVTDLLSNLIARYRALAGDGRVELSMNPYYHPILPLLMDFGSAREAAPDTPLPSRPYPRGTERAAWHLRAGRERFETVFGRRPRGCWPSEAAVSEHSAVLIEAEGFDWFATSQSVQNASLHHHGEAPAAGYASGYRLRGTRAICFFRDDGLSDRVGFVYKDWQPRDAVADLVRHLEQAAPARHDRTVVLALDGENPWEYYPENGIQFVRGLYGALADHPKLRLATFAQCLDEGLAADSPELPSVVAGSWVHGQLLTWIGHAEKNRAWELLIEAKQRFDARPDRSAAAHQAMGACEGSDWFWWPGANNPAAPVADFDRMFRAHLRQLYREIGEPPPPALEQPFASAGQGRALGAMLPGAA